MLTRATDLQMAVIYYVKASERRIIRTSAGQRETNAESISVNQGDECLKLGGSQEKGAI